MAVTFPQRMRTGVLDGPASGKKVSKGNAKAGPRRDVRGLRGGVLSLAPNVSLSLSLSLSLSSGPCLHSATCFNTYLCLKSIEKWTNPPGHLWRGK